MRIFQRFFGGDTQASDLDAEVAEAARKTGKFRADYRESAPGLARTVLENLASDHSTELARNGRHLESAVWHQFFLNLTGQGPLDYMKGLGEGDQLEYAQALLASGDFPMALQAYEYLLATWPERTDIATTVSALYRHKGDGDKADQVLIDFYAQNPTHTEPAVTLDADAKSLMVMAGNDRSRFKIGGKAPGTYHPYRSGGHFMLNYLLDTSAFNTVTFTVSDDNVQQVSQAKPFDLMINTIADADREFASLKALETYLDAHPVGQPIINHPSRVLETTRDGNYQRLNSLDGFVFPRTERCDVGEAGPEALATEIEARGFSYPFIVRETGTHTAVTTALVASNAELRGYLENVKGTSLYLIQFIENASAEGHYSKLRFFSIDKRLYPVVYHTDQVWNVHGSNRKTFMAANPWMLDREHRFLKDPASVIGQDIYDRLQTLPDMIGLDFFGFDFTILSDGSVLIFELNPAMRHSFVHGKNFPYMMPYLQNISDAFEGMVRRRLETAT